MKSYKYNPSEIDRHINACAVHDATARRYIRSADYRAMISPEGMIVTSSVPQPEKVKGANRCLLVQAWPGDDALTMVSYRLLGSIVSALPSELSRFEFVIDWSCEVGVKQSVPIILHVVEDDAPIFFNYSVCHHFGKKRDTFSANVHDLTEAYGKMTHRVCEHIMLVAQFHAKVDHQSKAVA